MGPERQLDAKISDDVNSSSSRLRIQERNSSADGMSSFEFNSERDPFSNGGSLANRLGSDAT